MRFNFHWMHSAPLADCRAQEALAFNRNKYSKIIHEIIAAAQSDFLFSSRRLFILFIRLRVDCLHWNARPHRTPQSGDHIVWMRAQFRQKSMNSLRSDYEWFALVIVFRRWMTMKSRSSNRFIQIGIGWCYVRSRLIYAFMDDIQFYFISYYFRNRPKSKLFSHLISGSLFRRRFRGDYTR